MEEERRPGYTADGYIEDQDHFDELRYRCMPASINGCGPIALFNLLRVLGREQPVEVIAAELDGLHRVHAPGPTSMRAMRLYLEKHLPEARETKGREEALDAAARSRAGIFRYWEGREPHFISYYRLEDGSFRFFNVADGLEDVRMSMAQFGAEHLLGGLVIALTVEE